MHHGAIESRSAALLRETQMMHLGCRAATSREQVARTSIRSDREWTSQYQKKKRCIRMEDQLALQVFFSFCLELPQLQHGSSKVGNLVFEGRHAHLHLLQHRRLCTLRSSKDARQCDISQSADAATKHNMTQHHLGSIASRFRLIN